MDRQLGLLSSNRNDPNAKKIFESLKEFFTLAYELEFKPAIWKYYPTPTFKKLIKTLDTLQEVVSRYVQEAMNRIEEQKKLGLAEKPDSEKSVLEKLVTVDKKIAQVMAIDMLMAGVDTVI